LKIPAWEELISNPRIAKAFQLLLYAYLYFRNQGMTAQNIQSGNITLRSVSEGFMKVGLPEGQEIGAEVMDIVEAQLKELCETILDEDIPFTQTEDPENCAYCPFKAICTR
jgi:CRISPR/Cas system-associated exonuclease Cas4 (RecB family)